mmetsp:Transcript_917/g.1973  ORF Transcript_917/g.1973 Transcript_917/m.1973 type:complete len:129 (-) Transcript_917:1280-1666(-)
MTTCVQWLPMSTLEKCLAISSLMLYSNHYHTMRGARNQTCACCMCCHFIALTADAAWERDDLLNADGCWISWRIDLLLITIIDIFVVWEPQICRSNFEAPNPSRYRASDSLVASIVIPFWQEITEVKR